MTETATGLLRALAAEFIGTFPLIFIGAGAQYYTPPGNLFRLMTVEQKQAFFTNTAAAMAGVPEEIQRHWIGHCTKADRDYGWGIARALGLKPPLAAE